MPDTFSRQWADRPDTFWGITGAIVPAGLTIGRVGFEAPVALVGVCGLLRTVLARDSFFFWLFANGIRPLASSGDRYRAGLITWPVVFLVIRLTGFNIFKSEYPALLAFFLVMIASPSPEVQGDTHG